MAFIFQQPNDLGDDSKSATTTYAPNTFRVIRIKTIRPASGGGTDILQDLQYQYDPVGNITLQTDGAHQQVYYSGTVASPDNDYTPLPVVYTVCWA